MRKLIEYRQQKALHHQLMKAAERSMLGIDAIVILYHCAKVSVGHILEVGSYVGGATIALAMGVRDSGTEKKIISIERGCRVDHPRVGTKGQFQRFEEKSEALRVPRSDYFDKWPLFRSEHNRHSAPDPGPGPNRAIYF